MEEPRGSQFTLGKLIDELDDICKTAEGTDFSYLVKVRYFGSELNPGDYHSYRGYYDELALGEVPDIPSEKEQTLDEFYTLTISCLERDFRGYKGGFFEMSRDTPVWLSDWGVSGSVKLISIGVDHKVGIVTLFGEET